MAPRKVARLLARPLPLFALISLTLMIGVPWYFRRPPSDHTIMTAAATVLDTGGGLCAEGCYERFEIVVEAVGGRQTTGTPNGDQVFLKSRCPFVLRGSRPLPVSG